jgi:hypothetical protein
LLFLDAMQDLRLTFGTVNETRLTVTRLDLAHLLGIPRTLVEQLEQLPVELVDLLANDRQFVLKIRHPSLAASMTLSRMRKPTNGHANCRRATRPYGDQASDTETHSSRDMRPIPVRDRRPDSPPAHCLSRL